MVIRGIAVMAATVLFCVVGILGLRIKAEKEAAHGAFTRKQALEYGAGLLRTFTGQMAGLTFHPDFQTNYLQGSAVGGK